MLPPQVQWRRALMTLSTTNLTVLLSPRCRVAPPTLCSLKTVRDPDYDPAKDPLTLDPCTNYRHPLYNT